MCQSFKIFVKFFTFDLFGPFFIESIVKMSESESTRLFEFRIQICIKFMTPSALFDRICFGFQSLSNIWRPDQASNFGCIGQKNIIGRRSLS